MSQAPTVSVIIAAFNAEGHIGRAIDSACSQGGVEVEVIVADDASADRTADVAEAHRSGRVRVVRLAANGGPSTARNVAVAMAQGDWLAILDADDEMEPGRLAQLVEAAEAVGADVIADNMIVQEGEVRKPFITERLDGSLETISLASFALNNRLFGPGGGYGYLKPLFRHRRLRALGLAYDPALRVGEDFLLVAELLAQGATYVRKRSAGYVYHRHVGSISHRLSAAAAAAMLEADRRLLKRFGRQLTPEAEGAMRAHERSLEEGVAYLRLLDALKQSRIGEAVQIALSRPRSLRHMGMPIGARIRRWRLRDQAESLPRGAAR